MVGAILVASQGLHGTLVPSAFRGVHKNQIKNVAEATSFPGPSKLLTEAALCSPGDFFPAEDTP